MLDVRWLIPPDPALEPPLGAPLALAVHEGSDRLLLLEAQPPELRVYDLSGEIRGVLGREGGGPGEYTHPIDLSVTREGVTAVLSMSGRVTLWNPEGELAGTVETGGAGLATEVLAGRGDTLYVKIDRFPPDDVSEFRVVTPDTALPRPRFRDDSVPGIVDPALNRKNHSYAVAEMPDGGFLLSPPGPDYLILRIGPDGAVRQTFRRPEVPPLRRSDQEVEATRQRIRERFAELGASAPEHIHVPETRSHVARLAVAPDTSIWALTRRDGDSVAVIDRFDARGDYVASYRLQLPVIDLAVGSREIYVLALGDLEVPGVAVASRPGQSARR